MSIKVIVSEWADGASGSVQRLPDPRRLLDVVVDVVVVTETGPGDQGSCELETFGTFYNYLTPYRQYEGTRSRKPQRAI